MSYFLALSKSHGENVLAQYQSLRAEGLLYDVLLEANGTEFPAHKSLLACSSDYFKAMFKDYTKESKANVIHLPTVSATGLQHVLDFIYTSWLSISMETLEETLDAARYLQITEAIKLCSQYIMNNLSPENCIFFANIASHFCLPDAKLAIEKYIISNLWRSLETDFDSVGLLELNLDSMMVVLGSDDIAKVKELSLLTLTLKWLNHDESRLIYGDQLLSHIRYGLVPVEDLTNLYSQSKALQTQDTKSLVLKAVDYHSVDYKQPIEQCKQTTLRSHNTQIILVGGGTANDGLVSTVLTLDFSKGSWKSVKELKSNVQNHCVCVIGNFLYVLGGETPELNDNDAKSATMLVTNRVHRYDPRFNNWKEAAGMLEKRAQFACCVIKHAIFAIGGRSGTGLLHSSVEMYDLNTNKWEKTTELPYKMHGHASTVFNETIYISGGKYVDHRDSSKNLFSYNPLERQWKREAPMTIARFGHQMATVKQTIFTFLGMYEPFCDIEKYDPMQNQWTRLKPLLLDRFCYGIAVMDENILLVGGKKWQDSQEVATQNIIIYDVGSDSWEEAYKLPLPLYGLQCAVLQLTE
uniref:Kelch like family member 34 n=1 Tax=Latimeria chalumnae TaxID=7897 RepID=H3A258_LATCH